MTPLELLVSVTVFVLTFYGFGYILSKPRRSWVKSERVEQILLPVYSSFLFAAVLTWILGEVNLISLGGTGGPSWGEYLVLSTPGERMLIALTFSITYIVLLAGRAIFEIAVDRRRRADVQAVTIKLPSDIDDSTHRSEGAVDVHEAESHIHEE